MHGDEQASLGLLGFALSARKEPKGELLRCVFNTGDAASPASSLIESCQRMDLFHNMFVNGRNGSYRTIEVFLIMLHRSSCMPYYQSSKVSKPENCIEEPWRQLR